jgi:hypothetical protein
MDSTGVSTTDLCKAVADELRNRGVDDTLLVIVGDERCVYMPAKIRGESDRLARGMFTMLRDYLNTIETEPGEANP